MLLLYCVLASDLHAGGSGLNTVVVVNQTSSNSCELGNYYCERRFVPSENLLRINWPGTNTLWTSNDFQTVLVTPLLEMLAARQLSNQIEYVVLSMDIPFQTGFGSTINGTTSALFYGLKSLGAVDVTNSYAGSEAAFGEKKPTSAPGISFLTTMITAGSLTQAKQLVDQGIASDSGFPSQPVILAKTTDPARNLRHVYFDNAIFNVKLRGISSILRTNSDSVWWPGGCLGYQTGMDEFNVPSSTFIPGAIADSMTSYGGLIFGPSPQTNALAFINAGAVGSYGTVAEPYTDTQKFPNPQVYFYQARGFSLAESYYQSIVAPFLGLIVAEPLAAPFARTGFGAWSTNVPNSILSNTPMLSVQFTAANGNRPLQQVDLFVDGKYFSTLTNLSPRPGNQLTATLNGYPITYSVISNDTLATAAVGLTSLFNDPVTTNATKVTATLRGDRVELQSTAADSTKVPFYVADTTPTNTPDLSYGVNYLPDSFPPRILNTRTDSSGAFEMDVEIPSIMHYVIEASTNLEDWESILTNTVPGLQGLKDVYATNYPTRFYRVVGPNPDQPPKLFAVGIGSEGGFQMRVESVPGLPWAILASTNFVEWSPIFTNSSGGDMDFVDADIASSESRFYKAWRVPPTPPAFSVLNGTSGTTLVRIDSAERPYLVEVSTNAGQWTTLATNFVLGGEIQTIAGSAIGSASALSSFLRTSRSTFLPTEAFGCRGYSVSSSGGNPPATGAWAQFTITLINGQTVIVGVTNLPGGSTTVDMASQLYALINTNSALQGSDGVVAEDFTVVSASSIKFNLRPRSPGLQAAAILVEAKRSSSGLNLFVAPAFVQQTITQNSSDLQSRNHLYVTAGASSIWLTFPLNTTNLTDGCHELTAVAYEGSHVRTQTRVTAPIKVRNSTLYATLALLDLTNAAPVMGSYHIEVAANTNDVSAITLFSTGGALETLTNQPTAIFEVNGTNLWAGLHPFYALVETSSGLKYRTKTEWVRFVTE
jgi:uncharacterized protein (TIGR03790 family)